MADLESEKPGMTCGGDSLTAVVSQEKAQVGNTNDNNSTKDSFVEAPVSDGATISCEVTADATDSGEDAAKIGDGITTGRNNSSNDDAAVGGEVNTNDFTAADSDMDTADSAESDSDAGSYISDDDEEPCDVCLLSFDERPRKMHKRPCCGLMVCKDCLDTYVVTAVDSKVLHVQCPGSECSVVVPEYLVLSWIRDEENMIKFHRMMHEARMNELAIAKTCPRCSHLHTLVKEESAEGEKPAGKKQKQNHRKGEKPAGKGKSSNSNDRGKRKAAVAEGLRVTCEACGLAWCYPCHAPWHEGMTCKVWLQAGKKQFKNWTQKMDNEEQINAQQCPECKTFISRICGCPRMKCTRCSTPFCYHCGIRLDKPHNTCLCCGDIAKKVSLFFVGSHESRLAPRGCRQHFLPNCTVARRFIRGSILGTMNPRHMSRPNFGKISAAMILGPPILVLGVGAAVVAAGVAMVAVPSYKCVKSAQKRRNQRAKAAKV